MDPLVLAAGTAVISAMATDGWEHARAAVVGLWRRARPDHVPAIEAELEQVRGEVVAARQAGDHTVETELAADWQRKLRRLLTADPRQGAELARILDEELTPLLPVGERERVQYIQNITASAPGASAQGVMFGNLINHGPSEETRIGNQPDETGGDQAADR